MEWEFWLLITILIFVGGVILQIWCGRAATLNDEAFVDFLLECDTPTPFTFIRMRCGYIGTLQLMAASEILPCALFSWAFGKVMAALVGDDMIVPEEVSYLSLALLILLLLGGVWVFLYAAWYEVVGDDDDYD